MPSKPSRTCTTSPSRHDQRTASTGPDLPEHSLVLHPLGRLTLVEVETFMTTPDLQAA